MFRDMLRAFLARLSAPFQFLDHPKNERGSPGKSRNGDKQFQARRSYLVRELVLRPEDLNISNRVMAEPIWNSLPNNLQDLWYGGLGFSRVDKIEIALVG